MAVKTDTGTRAARSRAAFFEALRSAATSPWAKVLGRATFVLVAIVVLAGIGRAAGARAGSAADLSAGDDSGADAGDADEAVHAPREPGAGAPPNADTNERVGVRVNEGSPNAGASSGGVGAGPRATPDSPVRLNLADEAELRRLPGVGPKRAQAILALRARVGRFQRIEDLLRVKGVGRATLKKWRPLVTLDAAPREHVDPDRGDGGAA
jgi:competence protein ComEA